MIEEGIAAMIILAVMAVFVPSQREVLDVQDNQECVSTLFLRGFAADLTGLCSGSSESGNDQDPRRSRDRVRSGGIEGSGRSQIGGDRELLNSGWEDHQSQ